jgi:hypothetical protein
MSKKDSYVKVMIRDHITVQVVVIVSDDQPEPVLMIRVLFTPPVFGVFFLLYMSVLYLY